MVVKANERALIQAARTLDKLQRKRERLMQELTALDREIDEARQALRTFTDGGQEQSGEEPPRLMAQLLASLGASER